MSQIEAVISDLSKVASGAWEQRGLSWTPEETVQSAFTHVIHDYVDWELKINLPHHRGCHRWEPGNLELQTRFARHLGILKVGQEFGDLEEDQRVIVITGGTRNQSRELQDLDPEIVWARAMDRWNPYGGYMRYYGSPCHSMNFPTTYGDEIRASVRLKPNDQRYLDGLDFTSIHEAIKSGLAYPVISLEIDPKLVLPE